MRRQTDRGCRCGNSAVEHPSQKVENFVALPAAGVDSVGAAHCIAPRKYLRDAQGAAVSWKQPGQTGIDLPVPWQAELFGMINALLGPFDPPAFSIFNEAGGAALILLCDHAGKAVPRALGDLGISPDELARHIGWDIGAMDVAQELSRLLDAPLVASTYSRLVIDCNRWPGGEGSIPDVSDGTGIPGNRALLPSDAAARAEACFWPYHRAVDAVIERFTSLGQSPSLLVIHSFTPRMN